MRNERKIIITGFIFSICFFSIETQARFVGLGIDEQSTSVPTVISAPVVAAAPVAVVEKKWSWVTVKENVASHFKSFFKSIQNRGQVYLQMMP